MELESLLKFENNIPEIILMDVNMPIMNGIEAVRIIREYESSLDTKRIPI